MFDVRSWFGGSQRAKSQLEIVAGFEQVKSRLDELCHQLISSDQARRAEPIATTIVCLWCVNGAPHMVSETVWLPECQHKEITIPSMLPIPRAAWVVVLGPAMLRTVQVGPQLQECSGGAGRGRVCVLRDPVPLGHRLSVCVEQPSRGVTYRA
jgi:hypothetical protein